MRKGKEKNRITLKQNQAAASSASSSQNNNEAYAQYLKRFGAAATAQPSPDVILQNYAKGGQPEQNLYKQLAVQGKPGQQSRNAQKVPINLHVLDDRLEQASDSKASNQQNMVGMGEVQRPLGGSSLSSRSGLPQVQEVPATHGIRVTRLDEELQKRLVGKGQGIGSSISLSINTDQSSSMSRTKFTLADYLSPDANAALGHSARSSMQPFTSDQEALNQIKARNSTRKLATCLTKRCFSRQAPASGVPSAFATIRQFAQDGGFDPYQQIPSPESFGKGPEEESSALTERETPQVSAGHVTDPLNAAWPAPSRSGRESPRESFLVERNSSPALIARAQSRESRDTQGETRKKLGKSDYLTWKQNRTPTSVEHEQQEKPNKYGSFIGKPPIAGPTPPLKRESFLAINGDEAALRDSKESKGLSTGDFGGKVQESLMFQPLTQDPASAPQQTPAKDLNDRHNVVAMLTPKEAGEADRWYQYPEQNALQQRASASSMGGGLQHEYRQGPVSAHPSAMDEPLSEQGYQPNRPPISGRDPAERRSVENASPAFKSLNRNQNLGQAPLAVTVSADMQQIKTERQHHVDALLLPNQYSELPEQKVALSDNGRASPACPDNISTSQTPTRKNLNHIEPLKPIFDSEALEKARRVNEEAAVKMANIRAMQEEILRPKIKKTYSSTRSNPDQSSQDASQEEALNATDQAASFADGSAAALEYFGNPNNNKLRQLSSQGHGRAKNQAFPNVDDDGVQSNGSSDEQVLVASSDQKAHVDEIANLRTQNGVLVLERALYSRLKASTELCFRRWKNIHFARKKMVKLFSICGKQRNFQASFLLRKGFNTWKEVQQRVINQIIAEELIAVTLMQRQLLTAVKETYIAKRQNKLLSSHFYAIVKLYRAKKEARAEKKRIQQAAKRIERAIRRQVKKRYRNSWKAIRGLVHASDLADEEVRSGSVVSSYSKGFSVSSQPKRPQGKTPQREQSRLFSGQSLSQDYSPFGRTEPAQDYQNMQSNTSQQQIQMFQGCFKVSAIQFQRYLKQEKATVQSLFGEWKRKMREHQMNERMPKIDFLDSNLRPFEMDRNYVGTGATIKERYAERHQLSGVKSQTDLTKSGLSPGSGDGIYISVFPQAREDQQLLQRLRIHDNIDDQGLSVSDVSSVQLDSDDSAYCTTVEVIKLKPVKKAENKLRYNIPRALSSKNRFQAKPFSPTQSASHISPIRKPYRKPLEQSDSKPPLPQNSSSPDIQQQRRYSAIIKGFSDKKHNFSGVRDSSAKRSATPKSKPAESKPPTPSQIQRQYEDQARQQKIEKYKRQAEKQIQNEIAKHSEEIAKNKIRPGEASVERKLKQSLLKPKNVYYRNTPTITSKSLAQLPIANIQHMFNPSTGSNGQLSYPAHKPPTGAGSRNRHPQIIAPKATQPNKARQNSQLSYNSRVSNKSAQENYDFSKPFVVINKFDNASSNYNTMAVTPRKDVKKIKLPSLRTQSQRKVYQASTYQPPTTRTRAMISRTRNQSDSGSVTQFNGGDFSTTNQSALPKNTSTQNSQTASPRNRIFVGQGLTKAHVYEPQPAQHTFGADLNSDIPPTPPTPLETKTYLEQITSQENPLTTEQSNQIGYEMNDLNEFIKYEPPVEVFSNDGKQQREVLSDESHRQVPEQQAEPQSLAQNVETEQQAQEQQEQYVERKSSESIARRSFAERVKSAFDKADVDNLMKDEKEEHRKGTLSGKESPSYFLKENFGSLKKMINQENKEKFSMRRETFGQDVKKEDMPVYSDYTTPDNLSPRAQSIRPPTGCESLSPQSMPNQINDHNVYQSHIQQSVRKDNYEQLARVTSSIFETRQKKFEVEFMLNLCLIYEQESEEADQQNQYEDQFQFYKE